MIYIAICDDNKKTAEILRDKVIAFVNANNIRVKVSVYTKSQLLLYDIQEGMYYDLILSDIEMPELDGMTLVSHIKRFLPNVYIIFITSYQKYAIDAFELNVFRYIPKTASKGKLEQALKDAFQRINLQNENCYIIQTVSRIEKIPYKKILYIQREGKNSIITLLDNSVTKVRKSLTQVYDELNSEDFIYVDRGNIVNLIHIMGIKKDIIEIKNGICLQASHSKIDQIKLKLTEFWSERI